MCNIILPSFKKFSASNFSLLFNPLISFSKLELLTLKKENDLWRNLVFAYEKRILFIGQMLWFLRIKNVVSKIMCVCKSLIDFNEAFIPYNELQFLGRPSIVVHSPTGLMYTAYGLMILVHKNHNNCLHSVMSELGVLACGRGPDLNALVILTEILNV